MRKRRGKVEAKRDAAKILVVDDSPLFRRAVSVLLEGASYQVEAVGSGEEAFRVCQSRTFDAVVSDIRMGALSGVQLCRLLRADPATRDLPVILLSAADDPRNRFWGRKAGAAAHVAKEHTQDELLDELARVLEQSTYCPPLPSISPREPAEPLERLSELLEALLFRAVVSTEVRRLIHHTAERQSFCRHLAAVAADVADYSYLVIRLRQQSRGSTFTVQARERFPALLDAEARAALDLPLEGGEVDLLVAPEHQVQRQELTIHDQVTFPILSGGETLGELSAYTADRPVLQEDRETLQLIAEEASLLTENLFLHEETWRLANHDAMTGLQNRRRISDRLESEVARARRHGTPLSVALVDVDHFKRINDQFGHAAGDSVLQGVAHRLTQSLRCVDAVGRWGGEEFLVLLPDTGATGASAVAERVRAGVESLATAAEGPLCVTCSVGLASFRGDESPTVFVRRADQALYLAKAKGRNRVAVSP